LGLSLGLNDKEIKKNLLKSIKVYTSQTRNPGNYKNLVSDIMSYSRVYTGSCQDNKCIDKIYESTQALAFRDFFNKVLNQKIANPQTYTMFLTAQKNYHEGREHFCSAMYDSGKMHYYCFETTNLAYKLDQYQWKEEKKCKRVLFKKKCGTARYEVVRPFTDAENNIVRQAVKSKSLDTFKSRFYSEYDDYITEVTPQADQKAGSDTQETKTVDNQKIIFVKNLKRIISSYRRTKPANYHPLVRNIQVTSDIRMDLFFKKDLDSYVSQHNLPDKVKNDLKVIVFSREPEVSQDVKYNVDIGNSEVEDIIGYAVKDEDKIFFTYIRTKTTGYIPNRVKRISERKCIKILFWSWCYNFPATAPDPLTSQELTIVKNALSYINLETIQKKINTISESQTLLGSQGIINSPKRNYVASKRLATRIDAMIRFVHSSHSIKVMASRELTFNVGVHYTTYHRGITWLKNLRTENSLSSG